MDVFSGDEIISDSFKLEEVFDGVGIEVQSKYITKGGENIDIGCGNAFGGNEDDNDGGDATEKVLDVMDVFQYQESPFTKKDYQNYIKTYMKKVKDFLQEKKPERVQPFMAGATEMVKFVLKNFDEFTFYTPQSYDCENIMILSYYKGEEETPRFLYFADGLREVKL